MTMTCIQPGGPASLIALGVLRLLQSCAARFGWGRYAAWSMALAGGLILTGCGGVQSTLAPAGREAEQIADLFWWMTAGSVIVWLAVIGLTIYAVRARS